jgi:hypothetical protein
VFAARSSLDMGVAGRFNNLLEPAGPLKQQAWDTRPKNSLTPASAKPLAGTRNIWHSLTLQRKLYIFTKFTLPSLSVRKIGSMVSVLNPKHLFDQAFHGLFFHWQQ